MLRPVLDRRAPVDLAMAAATYETRCLIACMTFANYLRIRRFIHSGG
jgi:hypothetical protein